MKIELRSYIAQMIMKKCSFLPSRCVNKKRKFDKIGHQDNILDFYLCGPGLTLPGPTASSQDNRANAHYNNHLSVP